MCRCGQWYVGKNAEDQNYPNINVTQELCVKVKNHNCSVPEAADSLSCNVLVLIKARQMRKKNISEQDFCQAGLVIHSMSLLLQGRK